MSMVAYARSISLKFTGENETVNNCLYSCVANSITTMTGYEDDIEKTKSKIIRDKYGRDWVTCDVYGYINKIGNTVIKGRIDDNIITDCWYFPSR